MAIAALLGSIGGSLSASELPYWAGHRAVLFSDLDSASFDTECNLTIVYSADGKQYSASVDLPERRNFISSEGQCNGSVDKTGVLERQDCTPGTISQRDIIGTVLNPILDNPGGGKGGRCTWADEALLKKRNLILAEARSADFQRGLTAAQSGDFVTALRKLEPFAKQGHAVAQSNLGVMYRRGRGVAQNYKTAVKWYRLAAVSYTHLTLPTICSV